MLETALLAQFPQLPSPVQGALCRAKARFEQIGPAAQVAAPPDLPPFSILEKRGRRPLFEKLTVMLDLSRGGVYTVAQLKQIARLAKAVGITGIGLYTEFFEVEDCPQIHQLVNETGQLCRAEISEFAGFARQLGLEVHPFIETFSHLERILALPRWQPFRLNGSRSTLDPLAEGVYDRFVEPLLVNAVAPYRHDGAGLRVNVGGDEVRDLQDPALLVAHLNAVAAMCQKHGLEPHIWGDELVHLPSTLLAQLSDRIQVAYWNYDETDEAVVRAHLHALQSHGIRVTTATTSAMAHNQLFPFYEWALANVEAVVAAAFRQGIRECLFTVWHDDNAEAPFQAIAPLMVAFAAIAHDCPSGEVESLVQEVCGDPLSQFVRLSQINAFDRRALRAGTSPLIPNPLKVLVFEKPGEARYTARCQTPLTPYYAARASELAYLKESVHPTNRLVATYAWALADYLSVKAELGKEIRTAQPLSDAASLFAAFGPRLILALEKLGFLWLLHRKLWLQEKKPNGLAKLDSRYQGAAAQLIALYLDLQCSSQAGALPEFLSRPGCQPTHFPLDRLFYSQI